MRKVKGVLIDTINNQIIKHTIDYNNYKDIVRILNCSTITCVTRIVNNTVVDIYCDDEALVRDVKLIPAVITSHGKNITEVIYNNCFICSHTKNGDIKSLTTKEIKSVLSSIISVYHYNRLYHCVNANI